MKLHANAALSLNKRRVLARRIVEEGWSLGEAAEGAETDEDAADRIQVRVVRRKQDVEVTR